MKVLSAAQLREWDKFTIQNMPISSLDLMERAANGAFHEILKTIPADAEILVLCGVGNNGGDGLVIARLLKEHGFLPQIAILGNLARQSPDFAVNLERCRVAGLLPQLIHHAEDIGNPKPGIIVIDALLGTGTRTYVTGIFADVIDKVNSWNAFVYSIDLPSGLLPDEYGITSSSVIRASKTVTFQTIKRAFLLPANVQFIGELKVLDIGLLPDYYVTQESIETLVERGEVLNLLPSRSVSAEKKSFGRSLVIGGSKGMIGAVVLAASACLRSGSGLTSAFIPACGEQILQTAVPEATLTLSVKSDFHHKLNDELKDCAACCIGPGLAMNEETGQFVAEVLKSSKIPLIIDADALNHVARRELLKFIPEGSLITPHNREFERLFGNFESDRERLSHQLNFSIQNKIFILRKGKFSTLTTPEGKTYFNSTGNPALAKGGSGDVLTGIITGLFARTGNMESAAILGTYLHGLTADLLLQESFEDCIIAGDLVGKLPEAFRQTFNAF